MSPTLGAGVPAQNAPTVAVLGPSPSVYRTYQFAIGDYIFVQPFHIDHDVQPGGIGLCHVHWTTDGTSQNGVTWEFSVMRALGHNQENFEAPAVLTVRQAAAGTAWRHMIAEVVVDDALTLTEPDELLLVVLKRVANTTGPDNADGIFGLMVDLHYESDRATTPNRSPDFYGT